MTKTALIIIFGLTAAAIGTAEADPPAPGASAGFPSAWNQYRNCPGCGDSATNAAAAAGHAAEHAAGVGRLESDLATARSAASTGLEQYNYGRGVVDSYRELRDAYRNLNARDAAFDPSTPPDGAPGLPVSCTQQECVACYRDAQTSLNRAMFTLGRLRTIFLRTKTFVDKAIAFGTSGSSIHAVQGLAWQQEKKKIEDTMDGMNKAYDKKKPELMGGLKSALDKIAVCEAEHFHNPDWYNRFGFMYYQFMNARYARE